VPVRWTDALSSGVRFRNVSGSASIRIYSTAGRLVATIPQQGRNAAPRDAIWKPPASIGAGVYFYRIDDPDRSSESGKIVILR
jgi:hypothetical protein